jgi:heme/copper-type cytochrome/quinol oxidase subunit 1
MLSGSTKNKSSSLFERAQRHRVVQLQLASVAMALLVGASLPLVARIASAMHGNRLIESGLQRHLMGLHATIMIHLVLVPGMLLAVSHLSIPDLITGSKSRVLRLEWTILALYWLGATFLVGSVLLGNFGPGSIFSISYNPQNARALAGLSVGVFLVGLACAARGYRILTALRSRSVLGLYSGTATAVGTLYCIAGVVHAVALPIQGCTIVLILLERLGVTRVIDPALGGNPVILRHLFWYYLQPTLLSSVLPAAAVISQVVYGKSRSNQTAISAIVYPALAFSITGFLTWGGHLGNGFESPLLFVMFSGANLLSLVAAGLAFPIWLMGLRRLEPQQGIPLWFAIGAIALLALWVLTGLPLGMVGVNGYLQGTYFEVGHLHFLGFAVCCMAIPAALLQEMVSLGAQRRSLRIGRCAWICLMFGSVLALAAQLKLGIRGIVPGRLGNEPDLKHLSRLSDLGFLAFAIGAVLVFWYAVRQPRAKGPPFPVLPDSGISVRITEARSEVDA